MGAFAGCSREATSFGASGIVLAQPSDSTVEFGSVGPFALTERGGREVTRESLLGRPWVAGFVFTRCSGPCPKITGTMRHLQDELSGVDARLVSFSVDPEWDTPEVLRAYADAVGADRERWWFLTGDRSAIYALIQKSFLSPVERAPDGSAPIGQHVSHRTQLVVVDKLGRLRGFYAGESDADVAAIAARVRYLASEAVDDAAIADAKRDASAERR